MEDYSHCHYRDNVYECIGFDCTDCEYKKISERDKHKNKVTLDEELFEI